MDKSAPSLEVGFEINPGASFEDLVRLQGAMDSTEARVVADAGKIEAATSGMIKLGGATASISAFGNAYTREMESAVQATNRAEKAGEGMVRQLQRQIETYGKSASEIRNMRAEQKALAAEAQGLDELAARVRAANAEINRLETGLGGATAGATKNRMAMQGASYQVQDFITQVSMGANPVNAFAVQGAQLAGQFGNIEGKAGNVARFFLGPWGLAITAGLLVLGPLLGKLLETNDALDDAVDKLKKDARETEINRQAKELYRNSEEGLIAAVRDRIAAQDEAIEKTRTQGEQDNIAAQKALNAANAEREKTKALLESAIAMEQVARIQSAGPGQRGELGTLALDQATRRVAGLEALLAKVNADVVTANKGMQRSLIELAQEAAKRESDPIEAIKRRYEDKAKAAVAAATKTANAGGTITKALTAELAAIERSKDAAVKAEQEKQSAMKLTANQIGRNISLAEGRRIAESVGGRITSDHRTFEEQQRLYEKYMRYKAGTGPWAALAAKPGTSGHELDQAVDVAKSDGMTLKKLITAYRAAGVKLTEALDEGDHYHIRWAKVGDAAKAETAAAAAAAKEVRDAAREAKKQVDDAQDFATKLNDDTSKIGKTAIEIKQIEVAAAAAKAPTQALRDAIYQAGSAWEIATKMEDWSKIDLTANMKVPTLTDWLEKAGDPLGDFLKSVQDRLAGITEQATVTGNALSEAFGRPGAVIGDLISGLSELNLKQQEVSSLPDGSRERLKAEKDLHLLQVKNTASAISGIKSLFKEHSGAYKAMTAIEKAYAIFQAIETAASIARDVAKTASSLFNSATRTTANTAEGGSKIFSQLGVYAFPVVAAMVAVLAALGAKGRGGTAGPVPTSAEDLQAAAGTGTVLGSPKDKSASIANSLELVAKNTNSDLQYSNQMLIALRSIDSSIGAMATTVARQINVNGSMFDTSGLKLGSSGSSGFLGLFASSTTRTLYDSGIQLAATTVGDIIAKGISGNTYQIVEQVKKKSGFLGIGGGTKTSYVTSTGGIPGDITSAVQDVIVALRNGLVTAANSIGIQGADAMINGFTVSIGTVSFKGMSGQEIEDQLQAIFSSVGDQMAKAIYPELAKMQQLGEGLFETFVRVAKEYETVDVELRSIGKSFGAVGVGSIAARDALVQLFGGLDEFITATDTFKDRFLTEAEKIAPIQDAVFTELARLGIRGVTTREQFKNVVLGLDLTTDAGRSLYASLLAVAPAFDKVLSYYEDSSKATTDGLQSTADKFNGFADTLKKFRETLFDTTGATAASTQFLAQRFAATADLAASGNATALGNLQNDAKAYLDAAKLTARTPLEYQRALASVAAGVDRGIFAAKETADYAQLQLDALKNATSILEQIAANTAATVTTTADLKQPVGLPIVNTPAPILDGSDAPATSSDIQSMHSDVKALLESIATSSGQTSKVFRSVEREGALTMRVDEP